MNKDEAKKVLEEAFERSPAFVHDDTEEDGTFVLNGDFTLPQLKAIVNYMESK